MTRVREPITSLSVLMPTWQGIEFLDRVLEALDAQDCALPWDLLVIDSGSTDGTVDRLLERAPSLSFPLRVEHIPGAEFDHGDTRNLLAARSTGDLLVYLTQDAIPTRRDWLTTIVRNFDDERVGAIYCRNVPREDATLGARLMCLRDPGYAHEGSRARMPDAAAYAAMSPDERRLLYNFNDVASAVRRDLWEVHPFPRTMMGEDVLMARGLIEAGHDVVYDAQATVDHSHDYGPEKLHWRGEVDARFNAEWLDRINVGTTHDRDVLVERLVRDDVEAARALDVDEARTADGLRAIESEQRRLRSALVEGLLEGSRAPKRYARSNALDSPRLSIVLVVERLPESDLDVDARAPLELARELLDRGHAVTVAARAAKAPNGQVMGVRVTDTPSADDFARLLEETGCDVVHAFAREDSPAQELETAMDRGVATVLSLDGEAGERAKGSALMDLARTVDRVLVPTVARYERIADGAALDQNRVVVSAPCIPHAAEGAVTPLRPTGPRVRALLIGDLDDTAAARLSGVDPDIVELVVLGNDRRTDTRTGDVRTVAPGHGRPRVDVLRDAEVAVVLEVDGGVATRAALEARAHGVGVIALDAARDAAWLDPGVVLVDGTPASLEAHLHGWRGTGASTASRAATRPVRSVADGAAEMEFRYRIVASIDRDDTLESAPLLRRTGAELSFDGHGIEQQHYLVLTPGAEAVVPLDGIEPGPVWLTVVQFSLAAENEVVLGGTLHLDGEEIARTRPAAAGDEDRTLREVVPFRVESGAREIRLRARYDEVDPAIHMRIEAVVISRRGISSIGVASEAHEDTDADRNLDRYRALRVDPGPPVAASDLPRVAIVVPSFDGRALLAECLPSLAGLDYPEARFDVIVVDNGSTDGTAEWIGEHHPDVRVVALDANHGFAAACNRGAADAEADVIVFVNNDMRFEPDFLTELVSPLARGECDATTARRMSLDGRTLDGAGVGSTFLGIAVQPGFGVEPGPEHFVHRRTLFPCGGAMSIRRATFEALGGFDEEFFAYYEDLDLGWRAWIAGYETHYVPSAVCTHHHSHTSKRFPPEVIRRMVVRNSLLTCIKNYDDANLARILPALSALATERAFLRSGLDADAFSPHEVVLRDAGATNEPDRVSLDGIGAADLVAMHDVFGNWDAVMAKRHAVQATRRRTDASIFEMFLEPLACVEGDASYQELQRGLRAWLGLDSIFDE